MTLHCAKPKHSILHRSILHYTASSLGEHLKFCNFLQRKHRNYQYELHDIFVFLFFFPPPPPPPHTKKKMLGGGAGGSYHTDTHLLYDRGDSCSTSAAWSYTQQDLEGKGSLN